MAQDRWFIEYIHSSPYWSSSRDDKHLTLTSGNTVVELEETQWPPWTDQ